jgi:ribosomal protein S6--L-glutamate ligase
MILSFHPCFVADVQIILGDRTLNSDDFALIREAGAIILPQSCTLELYESCRNSSAILFPDYRARFKYPGKVGQSLLFKELKCPHPETTRWPSVEKFRKAYLKTEDFPHEIPFLLKADKSHEGEGIYLVGDRRALESSLENLRRLEKSGSSGFVSQDLIPSGGNVLRVVIVGRRMIAYWKRPEKPGQTITTIGRGAKIDKDWKADLQEKGKIWAQEFSVATGINLAALDFVFRLARPDPQPLFLEVNYYFGRQGLGGSLNYYGLLYDALREWLTEKGFDPESVRLV